MAFSDWYEIIDTQSTSGQIVLNVYHVQKLSPAFGANDVLSAYIDTVVPQVLAVQPISLSHDSFSARSLSEPTDFAASTISPNIGTLSGVALSTFTAATIQFNRLRTDMKNGQKRWVAGTEAQVVTNIWSAALQAALVTLGQSIISQWEDDSNPGVPVCTFGILKRICTVQPPPVPCPSYRLPESDAELLFYTPSSFNVRDTVRSQVSRKRLVS